MCLDFKTPSLSIGIAKVQQNFILANFFRLFVKYFLKLLPKKRADAVNVIVTETLLLSGVQIL